VSEAIFFTDTSKWSLLLFFLTNWSAAVVLTVNRICFTHYLWSVVTARQCCPFILYWVTL